MEIERETAARLGAINVLHLDDSFPRSFQLICSVYLTSTQPFSGSMGECCSCHPTVAGYTIHISVWIHCDRLTTSYTGCPRRNV